MIFKIRPVPKGRPRASGRGKYITMYTPPKTKAFESELAQKAKQVFKEPSDSLLIANVGFYLKPAETISNKRKKALYGKYFDHKNTDLDNLQKSFFDALNKIAYKDDWQIVEVHAFKKYAEEDYIEIELTEASNDDIN